MRHIGFTGTRYGLTHSQREALAGVLRRLHVSCSVLHLGDCVGADKEVALLARPLNYLLYSHPPDIDKYRAYVDSDFADDPLPYLDRDRVIVESSLFLIACPGQDTEYRRSGTWTTVRIARSLDRPVVKVYPDGRVVCEYRRQEVSCIM